MFGLKISERYYNFYGKEMIAQKFPDYQKKIAVGLVGEGSDCFGFDDEFSRDHDWGPSFCMWLNKNDFDEIAFLLQKEYENLPHEFAGVKPGIATIHGIGRTGVGEINNFYYKFTGLNEPPSTWLEWIKIPENNLAACTNGKIFRDDFGEFTFYRNILLEYYPEDVRLKLIFERCITIGREGQYNVEQCARRNDFVAAHYALAIFIESAISLVYLLNYCYAPFYKWMHKGLLNLPLLGQKLYNLISELIIIDLDSQTDLLKNNKLEIINLICKHLICELNNQQLSTSSSYFVLDHVENIKDKISNNDIKEFNIKNV